MVVLSTEPLTLAWCGEDGIGSDELIGYWPKDEATGKVVLDKLAQEYGTEIGVELIDGLRYVARGELSDSKSMIEYDEEMMLGVFGVECLSDLGYLRQIHTSVAGTKRKASRLYDDALSPRLYRQVCLASL